MDEVSKNPSLTTAKAKHQIVPAIEHLAVDIMSVTYDPDNARLHPEKNKEAIKESLITYGQTTPIVVQKSTMHVVAGNGRLLCARELGWKKIAAVIVDMTDAEAAGYGLADNKTAELAKWDFESDVMQRIEKKLRDAGLPMTGWSTHELAVIRNSNLWVPPETTDDEFKDDDAKIIIKMTKKQYAEIDEMMTQIWNRDPTKYDKTTDAEYLLIICREWTNYDS